MKKIYLAGPIRHNFKTQGISNYDMKWREAYTKILKDKFICHSPIELNKDNKIKKFTSMTKDLQKLFFTNDIKLMEDSDILIANLIPFDLDNYPCLGTLFEIGYFYKSKKPVILITIKNSIINENPMYYDTVKLHSLKQGYNYLLKKF